MEMASGSEAISPGQTDEEKHFLTIYEIMTAEEFTEFNNTRKLFNQHILSGNVTREELTVQITLESMILNTCKQKIEQIMQETYIGEFNSKIEFILSNRIHDMYIVLFDTFRYDEHLVSKYIQFGLENKTLIKNYKFVLDGVMNSFHRDPEIYITGAHHAYNDCNDIESARQYISTGIQFHEDFKKLYLEDFWIEVKHLNQTGGTSLQAVLDKYNHIIQHFNNDVDLHFDLVDTALDEHIKITQLQCIIIRDMVNKYRRNELMWQKLAKIHLNGFVYNYDTEILQKIQSIKQYISISNCINTYDRALAQGLSPNSKQNLWNMFLDDMIDIHTLVDKNDEVSENYINESIDRKFAQAYSINFMKQPRHFSFWAGRNDGGRAKVEILKRGLNISKENFELWKILFEYYLFHDYMKAAMNILLESVYILKDEALPLWESMELYLFSANEKLIHDFYHLASIIVKVEVINLRFRPQYLEWFMVTRDLKSGRPIFNSLKCLKPKCYDLYKMMIRYETLSIISKEKKQINHVRKLYNEACNLFGKTNIELWYDCLQFEYIYGTPSLVDAIFKGGINLLEKPSLKAELKEIKYKLDAQFQENNERQFGEEE